jgi:Peptidase family C25
MTLVISTLRMVGQWGNEWIDYDKPYWKFPIGTDGFYVLSASNLIQSGIDWSSQDPHQVQVWGRGQSQNVHFFGDEDSILESDEFFFGYFTSHHGEMENEAYAFSAWSPDPAYSLFNDTLWYYLTTGDIGSNITTTVQLPDELNIPIHESVSSAVNHALHSHYYVGRSDNNGISLSTYDEGEGWYDPAFSTNAYLVNLLLPQRQFNSPIALSWRVGGVNSALGIPNHHLQVGLGENFDVIRDTTFTGHKMVIQSEVINPLDDQDELIIGFKSVNDLGVNSDMMALGKLSAEYLRNPVFENTQVHIFQVQAIQNSPWTKVNLQLNGYNNPQCYVLQNGLKSKLPLVYTNLQWELYIPWQGELKQKIILVESNDGADAQSLEPIQFVDYSEEFAIDNLVIVAPPLLWNEANNYALYKASSNQDVLLVDITQLYHQYGGGVEKNPLALRRFMRHHIDFGLIPSHLFLIGKSIHDAPLGGESGSRNDASAYARNVIPTWGYPGSDVLFTAGLNGTLYEPAVPTGRLAAESGSEVLDYLNKVIEFESQPPALWRKNVLHFGGGSIAYEQDLFRNYLDTYKQTAESLQLGAKVYGFYKNTAEPVQLNVSDSIQLLINEGVSVMTFFGHASSTGFDQNIDAPESYSNQGKYPLLIGNSCYTGNIHLGASQSASERFVMAPNRGVIGFLAKGDLGIPTYLDMYTANFYRHLFDVSYGASIGQCMQRAIVNFESAGDFYEQNVAQNFILHGDPSLVLFPFDRPDFALQTNAISVAQTVVPASTEPLAIDVVVQNIGRGSTDEIEIVLVQTLPNGVDSTYLHLMNGLLRVDTVTFQL